MATITSHCRGVGSGHPQNAVIAARRRSGATDDLVGVLVHAEIDGERLTDEEILWESLLILVGGDETTRHVITGGTYDPYYRDRGNYSPAYQRGYRDGLEKGRDDGNDGDRYDPNRHGWYRSADRGYDDDYGRKEDYRVVYRQGFEAGYAEGYRVYSRR